MNPWALLGIGLLLGFSMGSWLSRRKAVAKAVASVTADLEARAEARSMATGGSVIMLNGVPHALDDASYDGAGTVNLAAYVYDRGNGAALDPRRAVDGLGRLGPVGVVPDDGRGVVDGRSPLDAWHKPVAEERRG